MNREEAYDKIYEYITNITDEYDLMSLWNDYCITNGYYEDEVQDRDALDDLLSNLTPLEIIDATSSYDNENFVKFDGWSEVEGFDTVEDAIDTDDLINYIINEGDSLNDDNIEEILNEYEEEEEEEE